jgi:hypothetical protein
MGLVIGRGCTYPKSVTAQSHCLEACTLKSYQDIGRHDQATEYTLNKPPNCPTMWDQLTPQRPG